MPAGLKNEGAQIELEANPYIPYAWDEVNFDFEVLESTEGNTESVDVLLAACRRENIEAGWQPPRPSDLRQR
jgi:type IV pilus assembly protein PilM